MPPTRSPSSARCPRWRGLTSALCVSAALLVTVPLPAPAGAVDQAGHQRDLATADRQHRQETATEPSKQIYKWPPGAVDGGGSVSWRAPDRRASRYRNATGWWGGAGTQIIVKGPRAPHHYRFHLRVPDGMSLAENRFGEVIARRRGRVVGMLGRPWAHDAAHHRLRTSFSVRGDVVTQHIAFGRRADFPIKADPWWNPVSWDWGEVFDVAWHAVVSCGRGAVAAATSLGIGTGTTNILLKHVEGRVAYALPGGAFAYAGVAAAGCVGSFFF